MQFPEKPRSVHCRHQDHGFGFKSTFLLVLCLSLFSSGCSKAPASMPQGKNAGETAGFVTSSSGFVQESGKSESVEDEPDGKRAEAPYRAWEKSSFAPAKETEIADLTAWLDDQFGLVLAEICADAGSLVQKRGSEFWMLPGRYLETFGSLPSKSIGMRIASQTPGGLVPDNDWVSRFFSHTSGNRIAVGDEDVNDWLHGADIRTEIGNLPKGAIVMILDQNGIFLGCGRISGERIRNFNK